MLDLFVGLGVLVSLGIAGYGVWIALPASRRDVEARVALAEHQIKDLQTILTAAPPDMINASIMAGEWKRAMESLPEGSPRRQAFAERLKQLGAS